jgi:membrane-associated phospholipid phosphatase
MKTVLTAWLVALAWLLLFEGSSIKHDLSLITYGDIRQGGRSNRTSLMLVSELGGKYELGLIVLIARLVLRREDAFACAVALCFSVLINQVLKLSFQEPRPFFVNPGPVGTPCDDLEYGNPSGHAIAFTSLMLVFGDGVCQTFQDLRMPFLLEPLFRLAVLSVIMLVIFSRFYFGVHSLDQLMTGFVLGILVYIQTSAAYGYLTRAANSRALPFRLLAVFGTLFSASVFWYAQLPPEEIPAEWLTNIMKTCPNLKAFESPRIKTFKKLLYSSILFGVVIGNWVDSRFKGFTFSESFENLYDRVTQSSLASAVHLMLKWAAGCLLASIGSLIVLKLDILTDLLIGPSLTVNAFIIPVLANLFLFGFTRKLVLHCGLLIEAKEKKQ